MFGKSPDNSFEKLVVFPMQKLKCHIFFYLSVCLEYKLDFFVLSDGPGLLDYRYFLRYLQDFLSKILELRVFYHLVALIFLLLPLPNILPKIGFAISPKIGVPIDARSPKGIAPPFCPLF